MHSNYINDQTSLPKFFRGDIFCGFIAVAATLFVLRAYLNLDVFYSSNLDQQFLNPPMLHGIRLAWLGEGSFFFNYVTSEPMWGDPHYSPFYPFYGPISVIMYDVFGVEDYMVIGDFISLFHKLILTGGCYYLSRTLSRSRLIAIGFAVFVATSEATRIPANWYMAFSAYAWVPFMIGACIDIFQSRYARGVKVLTLSTTLSVFAAPIYLGLGIAIIPCFVLLISFLIKFVREDEPENLRVEKNQKIKVFGFLALSAVALLLLIVPILWAAYSASEDLIRWLRTGPMIGNASLGVGKELFHETQGFDYLKRLVTDYGARGVFSSYFLGSIVTVLFFMCPYIWLLEKKNRPKGWLSIRLILWGLALLHLSFIFGEKLIIPNILYVIPAVSSFRHLSAFGAGFIILSSLCAFDAIRSLLHVSTNNNIKRFYPNGRGIAYFASGVVYILSVWILAFSFSDDKYLLVFASLFVVSFCILSLVFKGKSKALPKAFFLPVVLIALLGVYQQQNTKFNQPMTHRFHANETDQLDAILSNMSADGEFFSVKISDSFSKSNRINAMQVQSHLSTKDFRVVLSYKTPRHFTRFTGGMKVWNGSLGDLYNSGVTLLITDKDFANSTTDITSDLNKFDLIASSQDFNLYRIQSQKLSLENTICINHNVCGSANGGGIDFNIFPYKELVFRSSDGTVLPHTASPQSSILSKVDFKIEEGIELSYKPKGFLFLATLWFLGLVLAFFSLTALRRIHDEYQQAQTLNDRVGVSGQSI